MILAARRRGLCPVSAAAMNHVMSSIAERDRFAEPVMLAAASGDIDLICMDDPQVPWPTRHLRESKKPTVVIVGDDTGNPGGQGGPSVWRCTPKAAAWAAGAIIHGAGGQPEHYAEAVLGATLLKRVILVETTSAHALAWRDAIGCARTLMILCRDTHPIDTRVLH